MKTTFLKIAATLMLIPALAQAAGGDGSTGSGTGSGNGDGDRAFALQKMASDHPEMSLLDVLREAFKESEHRIPTITYKSTPSMETESGTAYYGFFLGADTERAQGENIFIDGDKISDPQYLKTSISFVNFTPKLGPLSVATTDAQSRQKWVSYSLEGSDSPSAVTTDGKSLLLTASFGERPILEFRQYNSRIIIYASHAVETQGTLYCSSPGQLSEYLTSAVKPGAICAMGYYWIN